MALRKIEDKSQALKKSSELELLLPEKNVEVIAIGDSFYELYQLTMDESEQLSEQIGKFMELFINADKEGKGVADVIGEVIDNGIIYDILGQVVAPYPKSILKNITIPQLRHAIGVLWKINFSEDVLPDQSKKNFTQMLSWLGLNPLSENIPDLQSLTNSQADTVGQESTSGEDGESGVPTQTQPASDSSAPDTKSAKSKRSGRSSSKG